MLLSLLCDKWGLGLSDMGRLELVLAVRERRGRRTHLLLLLLGSCLLLGSYLLLGNYLLLGSCLLLLLLLLLLGSCSHCMKII